MLVYNVHGVVFFYQYIQQFIMAMEGNDQAAACATCKLFLIIDYNIISIVYFNWTLA